MLVELFILEFSAWTAISLSNAMVSNTDATESFCFCGCSSPAGASLTSFWWGAVAEAVVGLLHVGTVVQDPVFVLTSLGMVSISPSFV